MSESTVTCPKCGHAGIVITELLDSDLRLIADSQAQEIEQLRARVEELEAVDYDAIARRMAQVLFETPVSYAISDVKVVDRTREMMGGSNGTT